MSVTHSDLRAGTVDIPPPAVLSLGEGQRLLYLLRHERRGCTIAQLIAARRGEGTSTISRDLWLIGGRIPEIRVLLIDLDPPDNRQTEWLRAEGRGARVSMTSEPEMPSDIELLRLDGTGLSVGSITTMRAGGSGVPTWTRLFPKLREIFDIVLIDSPAIENSYDGIMLAPDVDANVLVVEAEATRSAVAQNLRDRIADVGGPIAGAILNKRRFHIPGFIYRRL